MFATFLLLLSNLFKSGQVGLVIYYLEEKGK